MFIQSFKTRIITPQLCTLEELLDESLPSLEEGSVVAIASKVISLCEGSVVAMDHVDKDKLIAEHCSYYLPHSLSRYNVSFAIANGHLAPGAGIDESNGNDHYILWPKDVQASANAARAFLRQKFKLQRVGVVITDSTTRPLHWGTTGVALAHSGFAALQDYIGHPDLFGRPFQYHKNSIVNGLAAAATVVMGEGAEQTPLAAIQDVPFVEFQDHDPTIQELEALQISLEDDLYAPFLQSVTWKPGKHANEHKQHR